MKFTGRVWKFGDDVNTDEIIPARYLNVITPEELARHCMEDSERPGFAEGVSEGDIIAAQKNFGCGSSREHAPIAIKAAGVSCVLAKSFARIFFRNAINTGLPILECAEAVEHIADGDTVEIDLAAGTITNVTKRGETYQAQPFPEFMQRLIEAGGLMSYIASRS